MRKDIKQRKVHWAVHCVKRARIRSFSGPYFPEFGLNMERYSASFRIQSDCGKIRIRKTPNTGTFYAVMFIFSLNNAPCLPVRCMYYVQWTCYHRVWSTAQQIFLRWKYFSYCTLVTYKKYFIVSTKIYSFIKGSKRYKYLWVSFI